LSCQLLVPACWSGLPAAVAADENTNTSAVLITTAIFDMVNEITSPPRINAMNFRVP
jgi:hypothetical protein